KLRRLTVEAHLMFLVFGLSAKNSQPPMTRYRPRNKHSQPPAIAFKRPSHPRNRTPLMTSPFAPPVAGNGLGYTPTDRPQNARWRSTARIKKTILAVTSRSGTPSTRGSVQPCDRAPYEWLG